MESLFSLTYYSFSALMNFVISLLMTLMVIIKNPRTTTNRVFASLTFSTALWSLFYFLWLNTPGKNLADFYMRTCMIPVLFMGPFFTHLVTSLLNKRLNRTLLISNYLISIFIATTTYTSLYAKEGGDYMSFNYWLLPGPLFHIHLLHFSLNVIYSFYLMSYYIRKSHGIFRNQILFVFVGYAIGIFAGMTNYFYWYRIPIPPVLNMFVSLYAVLMTYAIIKYRLMEINVVLKKGTVYAGGFILVLAPTYLMLLWTQSIFFKAINIHYSLILLGILTIAAIAFYIIKSRAEVAVEKVLFKNKYDYYKVLTNFTKELVSVLTLDELLNKIINTFTTTLKIKKASIFLFDEEKKAYVMNASYGLDKEKNKIKIKVDEPLISYFIKKDDVAIREEIKRYPDSPENREIIKTLEEIESEITIPFMEGKKIVGFCNLGAKGDRSMYSHEDIELFLSLGRQAAVAIQNAQLVERIKESKQVIRRMERLKTVGDLAAGFAHEIRNPLVPIKACLQLLPSRYGKDMDFTERIPVYALQEVERIERLLREIMDYSRPRTPVFAEDDINEVIEGTVHFIEYQANKKNIKILREYDKTLPKIRVDREQVKQVLLNLIMNAMDAVNGDGRIEIKTSMVKHILSPSGKIEEGDYIQIEVRDNGVGIEKENLDRIFNPFYTTKHESSDGREGTGLGLSIVQEIVSEHCGFVDVRSEIGAGSSFYVNLPVEMAECKEGSSRRGEDSI